MTISMTRGWSQVGGYGWQATSDCPADTCFDPDYKTALMVLCNRVLRPGQSAFVNRLGRPESIVTWAGTVSPLPTI